MSGAEAIGIVGLISSIITIIETARELRDAATGAKDIPAAFRAVSQNVPLVLNTLGDCKRAQEQVERDHASSTDVVRKRDLEASVKAARPVMVVCEENARQLKKIFEEVIPGDDATRFDRYRKALQAVRPSKKRKVEDLMKEIIEKLQLLHTNQFFKNEIEKRSGDLDNAIQQLSEIAPSLPEDDGRYNHYGSGPMNINPGDGIQEIYSQIGGSNNRQFNGKTFHFANA